MLEITETPLSIDKVFTMVRHPGAGGIVLFLGTVRNATDKKRVLHLEYEAFAPMAVKQEAKIEEEIRRQWNVKSIFVIHRTGRMEIGDIAVIIGVSAEHRHDAFSACRYMIDRIKQDVPIWKKEFFEDGGVWVEKGIETPGREKYA